MLLVFAILGTCAGGVAGLLGIGGGVILVPLFMWSFNFAGLDPHILVHCAFATSLAIIVPTAISNSIGHNKQGNICPTHVVSLAIGAIFGAGAGAFAASMLNGEVLRLLFGLMQIAVAAKMIMGSVRPARGDLRDQVILLLLTGFIGGAYSAFFGVGGGVVAVPLMVMFLRFPIHLAVGNSTALIVVSSFFGTCFYVLSGWNLTAIADGFIGYVFLPAVAMVVPFSLVGSRIGVHFAGRFSHAKLVWSFAVLLFFIGGRIILTAI
ncbi:MAG: hypothetical protein B6I36_05510 [Desulfobacteraceae bacterium 4572_35.1]|nr:MAG: hypothetical protein B6I36_05510 [Desulfobacteraceae bacterium 4572_35.1]